MEKYGLHDRQRKLLYLLNCEHGLVTGKDLAARLGISERTVRNDVNEINEKMSEYKVKILATRGKGYDLKVGSRKVFHELFSEQDLIVTREDRIRFLILKLVREDGWCDLLQLEDDLFVSRTTLENDLKEIRRRITKHQPYLPLMREGSRVRLGDDEVKRRNIMVRIYSENWDYDSRDGILLKDEVLEPEALGELRSVWKSVLRRYGLELDDFGLIYIVMASAVAHGRLLGGHVLPEGQAPSDGHARPEGQAPSDGHARPEHCFAEETAVAKQIRQVVAMFWNRMGQEWHIVPEAAEYCWLEDILRQLVILNLSGANKVSLAAMTDRSCKRFGVDFSVDNGFETDLILHIQAMMNSMVSVQTQSKYVIDDLRLTYPFLGEIARWFCQRLEQLCGILMGRDDEDFILPLFISAWERMAREQTKDGIRAVLVSHLNFGLSAILLDELRTRFGAWMSIEGPFPIYDRSRIDRLGPSLIIATARMDAFRKYPIPVITVSVPMSEGECKKIRQCITRSIARMMFPDPPRGTAYFRHEQQEFFVERRMELSQILALMEENLRSSLFVSELFALDWKQCSYAMLSPECLFVYGIGDNGQDTVMTCASCRYAVTWEQNKTIRRVILMIINEREMAYIGSFYRILMEENNG